MHKLSLTMHATDTIFIGLMGIALPKLCVKFHSNPLKNLGKQKKRKKA